MLSANPPEVVTSDIKLLFDGLTAPESQISFDGVGAAQKRASVGDIATATDSFELRTSAADADAYHDFFRLQLAFEDVWMELIDTRVGPLAISLYQQWNALMDGSLALDRVTDRTKTFSDPPTANGNPINISGADDLKLFIDFLRNQFGIPTATSAGAPAPPPPLLAQIANALADTLDISREAFEASGGTGEFGNLNLPDGTTYYGVNDPKYKNYIQNVKTDSDRLRAAATGAGVASGTPDSPFLDINYFLNSLDAILKEKYRFDVFAPNSINYGLLLNYRQKWHPVSYQVGNLVSTIPLAPQEVRRYTTKTVIKKTRSVKEIEDSLRAGKEDSSETTRVDSEIVSRAKNQTNFQTNASGSFGNDNLYKVSAGTQQTQDQAVESAQTKHEFHEAVVRSAQEYRNEHRMEINTEESREDETTSYREIKNPNDELTVTYLFYELQRRYDVEEALHKVTPVILVANDVPAPHEVDQSWLLRHDWIIKRVILDDSFQPALDYLSANYTGTEVTLKTLGLEVEHQRSVVDKISQQVQIANDALSAATLSLQGAESQQVGDLKAQEQASLLKSFFDPLGITRTGQGDGNSDRAAVDFAKDALDRAQTKVNQLVGQLKAETTALQVAIDKYTKAATEHFNMLAEIDRLRIHVKDNILYYMQAIWTYEPADQRFFRLYDIDVPVFKHHTMVTAKLSDAIQPVIKSALGDQSKDFMVQAFPAPEFDSTMKLHQVADLENLIGFKGNYMIFPMVNFNYMTWFMIKDYINFIIDDKTPNGGTVCAKDPDPLAGLKVSDLEAAFQNIQQKNPASFDANEQQFKEIMIRLLSEANSEVIVPSNSLFIEALPGTHPLLEDFKLIHRAIDVKKTQAEARHAELENLRLAARLLNNEHADPDIDKKIIVEGGKDVTVGT